MDIDQKLDKYFAMTSRALQLIKLPERNGETYEKAMECIQMAQNYLADAQHFREKGDSLTALAACSYAHAWLDAGARFGFFTVDNSEDLFVVD